MKKQYLTFNLDGQVYGVPIQRVKEINRIGEVTPIPRAPSFVAGVMNLRGEVITVISLRSKFDLNAVDNTKDTCSILVEGKTSKVAAIVDGVRSVVDVEESAIETGIQSSSDNYVEGFVRHEDRIIILVDVDKCFFSEQDLSVIAAA